MSDFYGLDPDLATTALAGEGEVKVFVEVAEFTSPDSLSFEGDATLWGTDSLKWGMRELGPLEPDNLPVQQIADHRLVSIPSVTSSSDLGLGFSNFTFSLRNNDDKFTNVDYVGTHCRLWSIDSTARRIVATGRITGQIIRLATADFTVSSLPVRELSEHFPRRQLDAETFPYGNNLGERDVPVVVGRVEFMQLIKIGDKISTTLTSAASIGERLLNIEQTAGIAIGDRQVIGLATENKEIVTVQAVDTNLSTITLTDPLENAHLISDTVTNYDPQIDYLIGEGVIPSVDDVYNEGRLTREYESEGYDHESTGTSVFQGLNVTKTFHAGLNWIQLPSDLRVPKPEWYKGYTITIGDQSTTVENYYHEAAEEDDNERQGVVALPFVISFNLAEEEQFMSDDGQQPPTPFSLKSYRLFDGSQDYPYPTYAFIRFAAEGITGNVHANVRGLTNETNPARLIESVLSHSRWGAGATVDSASFTTASAAVSDLKFEGAITSRVTVQAIIQQIASMRELELSNSSSGVSLSFATTRSSTATLPDRIEEYLNPPPEMSFAPLDATVKDITLRYRPGTQTNEWQGELTADVVEIDGGLEQKLDYQNVWTTEVADRILHYHSTLARARRKLMTLTTHLLVKRGDVVTLPALSPFTTEASDWEVLEVSEEGGISNVVTLASYDPNTYVYPAGRVLTEPLPIEFVPDYSQTFPPPVTDLRLSSCVLMTSDGSEQTYIAVEWDDPDDDNYNGAIVRYKGTGGDDDDSTLVEFGRNLMSSARIPVNIADISYTVSVFSQSPNNELEGLAISAPITPDTDTSSSSLITLPNLAISNPTSARLTTTIGRWRPVFTVTHDSWTPPANFRDIYVKGVYTRGSGTQVFGGGYYGPFSDTDTKRIEGPILEYEVESVNYTVSTETFDTTGCVSVQEAGTQTFTRPQSVVNPDLYRPSLRHTLAYRSVRRSGSTLTFTVRVGIIESISFSQPSDWAGLRLRARVGGAYGLRDDGSHWFGPSFGDTSTFNSLPATGGSAISTFPRDINIVFVVSGSSRPATLFNAGTIYVQIFSVRNNGETLYLGSNQIYDIPATTF